MNGDDTNKGVCMQHVIRACVGLIAVLLSCLVACGGNDSIEPDTSAPAISLSASVDDEAVVLLADVSDDVGVIQVDFLVDGGATRSTTSDSRGRSEFSLELPLEQLGAGGHTAVARAHDAAGNSTESTPVRFDVVPPESAISPIAVDVSASVDGSSVTFTVSIESDMPLSLSNFFLDGEYLGGRGDDQREFSFTQDDLTAGTHRLLVDVTDAAGNRGQGEVNFEI